METERGEAKELKDAKKTAEAVEARQAVASRFLKRKGQGDKLWSGAPKVKRQKSFQWCCHLDNGLKSFGLSLQDIEVAPEELAACTRPLEWTSQGEVMDKRA